VSQGWGFLGMVETKRDVWGKIDFNIPRKKRYIRLREENVGTKTGC